MTIVGAHPTGNANSREAMLAYANAGWLARFFTTIAVFEGGWLERITSVPGFSEIAKRRFPPALRSATVSYPARELARLAAQRLGWQSPLRHEAGWASIDAVYRGIDHSLARWIAKHQPDAVHAYEDGAFESFEAAERVGTRRILDHPVAHWRMVRMILEEERDASPEWASTLTGLEDSVAKCERKDRELSQADLILVPSEFSLRSLEKCPFPLARRAVIPFGGPSPLPAGLAIHPSKEPLRVLFVGGLGQMKGLSYLFQGVEALGSRLRLTVIGRRPHAPCAALDRHLSCHRWIPALPHEGILNEMARHDVLVFPSLCDGFGMVVTEALSRGLPVIATPHTCGPDVIEEGRTGFIVPVRNADAITARLDMLDRNREQLESMRCSAMESMRERTWATYREMLLRIVRLEVARR